MSNPTGDNLPHLAFNDFDTRPLDTIQEHKPSWRGWIHAGVLPIAIAAGIVLVVLANGVAAKAVSAIFFATSILLFGNSALYHRFHWRPRTKKILKRIDHANILLLIAGSYTPITWLALPKGEAVTLMLIIWITAVIGIGFRVFWISAPRWLYVPIYIGMGWVALGFVADFMRANAPMMILILCGGLLYSIGAAFYAFKWPGKNAKHFGFHEYFHGFTVAAFLCHWTGILLIALHPAVGSWGA